jgi:hypothetical protein
MRTYSTEFHLVVDVPPRVYFHEGAGAVVIRCGKNRIVLYPGEGLTVEAIMEAMGKKRKEA